MGPSSSRFAVLWALGGCREGGKASNEARIIYHNHVIVDRADVTPSLF